MLLECATRVWSLLQLAMVVGMVLSLLPLRFSSSNCSNLFSLLKKKQPHSTLHSQGAATKPVWQRRPGPLPESRSEWNSQTPAKGTAPQGDCSPDLSLSVSHWVPRLEASLASLTALGSGGYEHLSVIWLTGKRLNPRWPVVSGLPWD